MENDSRGQLIVKADLAAGMRGLGDLGRDNKKEPLLMSRDSWLTSMCPSVFYARHRVKHSRPGGKQKQSRSRNL